MNYHPADQEEPGRYFLCHKIRAQTSWDDDLPVKYNFISSERQNAVLSTEWVPAAVS